VSLDVHGFADPWEHVRLLSDDVRNNAMIALITRRAPGARVLEVGCGTGLLSLIAARCGASEVWAVEPTALAEVARQLVRDNGLDGVVRVVESTIEELDRRPVDLAFSELLNADPFLEGVVSASAAAARWVVGGGHLAPSRLRVWCAPVVCDAVAKERTRVSALLARLQASYDLELGVLRDVLGGDETERTIVDKVRAVGEPVQLYDIALGEMIDLSERMSVTLRPTDSMDGVVVWFEAQLDDDVHLSNAPGQGGHWGQLQFAFLEQVRGPCTIEVEVDEGELDLRPA
jgi:SAM-dependent methyltransferase